MFKGKWVFLLLQLTHKKIISLREAVNWGIARFKTGTITISFMGITFNKVDRTFWGIITDVFLYQVYCPSGIKINKGDVVVDIGAHRGAFTAYAIMNGAKKVISYEPNPENYLQLSEMLKINKFMNVYAFQKGVAAHTGKSKLIVSPTSSRHALERTDQISHNHEIIEVEICSLSDCLLDVSHIDFLKMDCEGAEWEILLSASPDILSKIKNISMEIHKPVKSKETQALINHLKKVYPRINTKQQKNTDYGYLFASQYNP